MQAYAGFSWFKRWVRTMLKPSFCSNLVISSSDIVNGDLMSIALDVYGEWGRCKRNCFCIVRSIGPDCQSGAIEIVPCFLRSRESRYNIKRRTCGRDSAVTMR